MTSGPAERSIWWQEDIKTVVRRLHLSHLDFHSRIKQKLKL